MNWEVVSSKVEFDNEHLSVATEQVRAPGRTEPTPWIVAHRKRAVGIAAMTADNKILLIRQELIPIRSVLWEMPAGQIDDPSDVTTSAIEKVALQELREETGYELSEGGTLVALGDFFTSPGFTDEHVYLFLARPVRPSAKGSDGEEAILDCKAFSGDELIEMINGNEIRDANTLSICAKLMAGGIFNFGLRIADCGK